MQVAHKRNHLVQINLLLSFFMLKFISELDTLKDSSNNKWFTDMISIGYDNLQCKITILGADIQFQVSFLKLS